MENGNIPSVKVAVREATKVYPGVVACDRVSIQVFSGEIHALFGENGAGKSTIVKILAGLIRPEGGTVEVDSRPVVFYSPRQARKAGIGVVHQSSALIETMTVRENLKIGTEMADHAAAKLGMDGERLVLDLSPREARIIAIHRLLAEQVRVLVLDEPTAMLSPQESQQLFNYLRQLANKGYGVLVVSHKLPEVLRNADRVTVLKRGRVAGSFAHDEFSAERLEELVQANSNGQSPNTEASPGRSSPLGRICGVTTRGTSRHEWRLQNLDLQLRRNEVLGIAGPPGSGVGALMRLLSGEEEAIDVGRVEWMENKKPRAIGIIPADRTGAGVIRAFTVGENLALRRRELLNWPALTLGNQPLHNFASRIISRFNIVPPDPDARVGELSGGNLQKVLLAREIDFAEELLVAINPTAGLDVASTKFVQRALRNKAASGCCVVVYSEDADELIGLADRVAVLVRGRKVAELSGEQLTCEAVGRALMDETPIHFGDLTPVATTSPCAN